MNRIKWDGAIGTTEDGYYAHPDSAYGWRVSADRGVVGFAKRRGDLDVVIERDRALTRMIEREQESAAGTAEPVRVSVYSLTLNAYQRGTRRTIDATAPSGALTTLALGLAGEAGEVCDLIKKIEHGHPVDGLKICEELGDALFYLAAIADRFGIPLSTVARENERKLHKRYPDGFSVEASIARADVTDDCDNAVHGEDI